MSFLLLNSVAESLAFEQQVLSVNDRFNLWIVHSMKKQGLYYWINNAKRLIYLSVVTRYMEQNSYGTPLLADIIRILEGNDAVINVIGINYSLKDLHDLHYIDDSIYGGISSEADKVWDSIREKKKRREYLEEKGVTVSNDTEYKRLNGEFYESVLNLRLEIDNVPKNMNLGKNIVVKKSDLVVDIDDIGSYEVDKTHMGYSCNLHAEIKLPLDSLDTKNHPLINGFTSDKIYEMEITLGNTSITYEHEINDQGRSITRWGLDSDPNLSAGDEAIVENIMGRLFCSEKQKTFQ